VASTGVVGGEKVAPPPQLPNLFDPAASAYAYRMMSKDLTRKRILDLSDEKKEKDDKPPVTIQNFLTQPTTQKPSDKKRRPLPFKPRKNSDSPRIPTVQYNVDGTSLNLPINYAKGADREKRRAGREGISKVVNQSFGDTGKWAVGGLSNYSFDSLQKIARNEG